MVKVKLKAIVYQCDFRKSDKTLFLDFAGSSKYPGDLGVNEAFLFVAGSETQMVWWFRSVSVDVRGAPVEATHAYRTRLDARTPWNPLMLADYAQQVNIELQGIRTFKSAFDEQRVHVKKLRALQYKERKK